MADSDDNRPTGSSNARVRERRRPIPWVWEGVLAEQAITLLSAPEKTGKTTLLSLLLDRRRAGGELLGRAVYLDFGSDLVFHSPRGLCPARGHWRRFINEVCEMSDVDNPIDLLVIDNAAQFIPMTPRNPRVLRWALGELRLVADFPAAVLLLNQSRNMHRPLAAFADIVIDMTIPRRPTPTQRAGSRASPATPARCNPPTPS